MLSKEVSVKAEKNVDSVLFKFARQIMKKEMGVIPLQ